MEESFDVCDSDWTDHRFISVFGDEERIAHVDECATGSGWTWIGIEPIDGDEAIELCGGACESVENGEWEIIEVNFWCCLDGDECNQIL